MFAEERVVETGFSFSNEVPPPPERRGSERHIKILRVGTLVVDGRRELCLIRNISAGGVMAHVYSSFDPGQRVTVELKASQPVTGRVVWVRGGNAGIQFDTAVDVAELLANPRRARQWLAAAHAPGRDRPDGDLARRRPHLLGPRPRHLAERRQDRDRPAARGRRGDRGHARGLPPARRRRALAAATTACGIAFNQLIPFGELIDWLKQDGNRAA